MFWSMIDTYLLIYLFLLSLSYIYILVSRPNIVLVILYAISRNKSQEEA